MISGVNVYFESTSYSRGFYDQLTMYCLLFKIWIKIFVIFILFSEKKRNQPIWHIDMFVLEAICLCIVKKKIIICFVGATFDCKQKK